MKVPSLFSISHLFSDLSSTIVVGESIEFRIVQNFVTKPHSSVGRFSRLENRRLDHSARPIFILRIDDSHCDRKHFSITAVRCFNNGYLGKQLGKNIVQSAQESMDWCTGHLKYCCTRG